MAKKQVNGGMGMADPTSSGGKCSAAAEQRLGAGSNGGRNGVVVCGRLRSVGGVAAVIEVRLAALKGAKAREYALRFLFGGSCTVLAGVIAEHYGPVVGGLFLAFPAIFPASATLLERHETEQKQKIGSDGTRRGRIVAGIDAKGAVLGAAALAIFALVVWKALPSGKPGWVIGEGLAAWMAAAAILWGLYRIQRGQRLRRARRAAGEG